MVKEIRWSPKAVASLTEICDHIAKDSEYYASLFAKRIIYEVEKLSQFPRVGRIVPEFDMEFLREVIYQDYRIVYRIKGELADCEANRASDH